MYVSHSIYIFLKHRSTRLSSSYPTFVSRNRNPYRSVTHRLTYRDVHAYHRDKNNFHFILLASLQFFVLLFSREFPLKIEIWRNSLQSQELF